VLARIGLDATADPRQLVDEHGFALGLHELGDDIASSIESVEFEGGKLKKVKLASKTIARRTILEVTGKVNGGNDVDRLADALRETLTRAPAVSDIEVRRSRSWSRPASLHWPRRSVASRRTIG
jgi:hypothetical protein